MVAIVETIVLFLPFGQQDVALQLAANFTRQMALAEGIGHPLDDLGKACSGMLRASFPPPNIEQFALSNSMARCAPCCSKSLRRAPHTVALCSAFYGSVLGTISIRCCIRPVPQRCARH